MEWTKSKEFITHEADNPETWVCICGNMPDEDGFYPCDVNGKEVEPIPGEWEDPLYVCNSCRRIIDRGTLEVVGRFTNRTPPILG